MQKDNRDNNSTLRQFLKELDSARGKESNSRYEALQNEFMDLANEIAKSTDFTKNRWISGSFLEFCAKSNLFIAQEFNLLKAKIDAYEQNLKESVARAKEDTLASIDLLNTIRILREFMETDVKDVQLAIDKFIEAHKNQAKLTNEQSTILNLMLDSLNQFKISKIVTLQSDRYLKIDHTQTEYVLNLIKYDYWYKTKTDITLNDKSNARTLLFINSLSNLYPGILMNKKPTKEDVIIIKSNNKGQCLYKNGLIIPDNDICNSAERSFQNVGNSNYQADLIAKNGELKSFQTSLDFTQLTNKISFMFQAKSKEDIDFFAFCNQKTDGNNIKMFTLSTLNKETLNVFNKVRKWYLDYNQFGAEMAYKYNLNLTDSKDSYLTNDENEKNIPTTIYIPVWCFYNTNGWNYQNIANVIVKNVSLKDGIIFAAHNNINNNEEYLQILNDLFITKIRKFIDKEISKFNSGCNDFNRRIDTIQEKLANASKNDKPILENRLKEFLSSKQTFKNRMREFIFLFIDLVLNNTHLELKQELQTEFLKSYNKEMEQNPEQNISISSKIR